jgi:K+-transporting ATPase A subunit
MTTSGSMGTTTGIAGSAIDSYQPVGVGSALGPMLLGEVGPGGVGSGLVGAINNTVIAVFVGGLMVRRTPELLGRNLRGAGDDADHPVHGVDAGTGSGRHWSLGAARDGHRRSPA